MQGQHRTEFPRSNWLPRPLIEAFARNGFEDTSWGNDACPTYSNGTLTVFCEAKDASARELRGPRYAVVNNGAVDVTAFERTVDLIAWLDQLHG